MVFSTHVKYWKILDLSFFLLAEVPVRGVKAVLNIRKGKHSYISRKPLKIEKQNLIGKILTRRGPEFIGNALL